MVLLALWAGGGVGCANLAPVRDAGAEQELRRRIIELERKAIVAELEMDRLRQRLARLEPRPPVSAGAPVAPPGRPTPSVPSVEPRNPPAPTIASDDLAEVESVAVAKPSAIGATVPAPLPVGTLEPAPAEARAGYDRAFALFHQGLLGEAEKAFRDYLEVYRANELSDNAVYWIGECRLARADWNGALRSFQEVIERFPTGNKVPDAWFKAGQSLERLGDTENARVSYQLLVERFPESGAGALARERLALLPAP